MIKNKSFMRESICERLYNATSYMGKDQQKDNHIIYENLQWLWKVLRLDEIIDYTDGNNSVELPPIAHNRQVNMLLAAIRYTTEGKAIDAYSKLYDFIDNYQQNYRDPLNNWELIAIKAILEGLIPLVKNSSCIKIQEGTM